MAEVFDIEVHDGDVLQKDDSEDDIIEIGEVKSHCLTSVSFVFTISL